MGRGENHQLPAAPSWGSAEKGLSLPVPLSFLSLSPIPGCCEQFKPSLRNTLNSATFYIANHQVQTHVLLIAALKHKHTYTETHTNTMQKGPFNPSAPAEEWQSSRAHGNMAPCLSGVAGKAHRSILALQ